MPVTAAQVGLGLVQSGIGLANAAKTKKIAGELEGTRPKRRISPYAQDAYTLSQSELANGMSSKAEQAYNAATDRSLSSSIDALMKGGGSVNNIGEIYGNSEQGRLNLAMMQDQLRLNQVNSVLRQNELMNDETQKQFEFNDWMPWADKAQANAAARQGAQQQIWSGINSAGSAIMNYGAKQNQQESYDNYFKVPGAGASASAGGGVGYQLPSGGFGMQETVRAQPSAISPLATNPMQGMRPPALSAMNPMTTPKQDYIYRFFNGI